MVRDLLQLNTLFKRMIVGALVVFVTLCAAYGVFLKATVASVVTRRSVETQRSELAAKVSVLEADYIRKGNLITREKATDLGFVAVTPSTFVSRANTSRNVSLKYGNEE